MGFTLKWLNKINVANKKMVSLEVGRQWEHKIFLRALSQ